MVLTYKILIYLLNLQVCMTEIRKDMNPEDLITLKHFGGIGAVFRTCFYDLGFLNVCWKFVEVF